MSREDVFDRILQSLHAAAFADARWTAASGLIDEAIGARLHSFLPAASGRLRALTRARTGTGVAARPPVLFGVCIRRRSAC